MMGEGLAMKCEYEGSGAWEGRCIGTRELDPCKGYESCKNYRPDCEQEGCKWEYRTCLYNSGVKCRISDKCHKCGWHPKEAARRKELLKNVVQCLFSAAATENE